MCGSFFQLRMPFVMVDTALHQIELDALEKSFLRVSKWPSNTIFKIAWMNKTNSQNITRFKQVIDDNFRFLNLNIVWDADLADSNVRISFETERFNCVIGSHALQSSTSEPTMWIGDVADIGGVIHQFCHMLGMIHEMDLKITVIPSVMREYMKRIYNYSNAQITYGILPTFGFVQSNAFLYDDQSIMNYAFTNYSNKENKLIPYNSKLSKRDREWLSDRFSTIEYRALSSYRKVEYTNIILSSIAIAVLLVFIVIFIFGIVRYNMCNLK